jgi:hypothetical protein
MSIRQMTAVWEKSKQKGSALLLLLAIADFANDDGVAWPAVGTLADKIRMDVRYTHRLLNQLVEDGELTIQERAGPHGCNLFTVKVGVAPAPDGPRARVAKKPSGARAGGDGARARKGMAPAPAEPPENHQDPPSARPRDEMFDAVVEVCRADAKLNGSTVGKVVTQLKSAGYTSADVRAFGEDWWAWDQRTKAPSVWKLRDGISQVRAKKSPNGAAASLGALQLPESLLDG